jgi:hypothetical protein
MNRILNATGKTSDQTQLSLVALSEYAIADSPEIILALLAKHGAVVIPPREDWRLLSGGLEYNHYLVEPITVEEIVSRLIIEITQTQDRPKNSWLNGLELQPWDLSQNEWRDQIRLALERDFETNDANECGVEKFARGATECILLPVSATTPARLLMHRRVDLDGPD